MRLTDSEIVALQADPITAQVINRMRGYAIGCDLWAMAAADPICLQVLGRMHTRLADDAEKKGHYGSVKYHEERRDELKSHWEAIERAKAGERKRIEATLRDPGYQQENGKIKLPIHEKGRR